MLGAGGEKEQRAANPHPRHRTDTSESCTWDHCLAYANRLFLASATVLETSHECNRLGSGTMNRETGFLYEEEVTPMTSHDKKRGRPFPL